MLALQRQYFAIVSSNISMTSRDAKEDSRESNMDLGFIEAFYWVAELGSMQRAADKLGLGQATISHRIEALENELRTPLLERRGKRNKGSQLTNAGIRFLSYAERFIELQVKLKNELSAPGQHPFTLRIGGIETVLHTWLIPMLARLKTVAPKIEFDLSIEMTPVLVEQLIHGGHDLVFSAMPAGAAGIVNETLSPLEMVFVGPAAMAGRPEIANSELLALEFMTFQRGSQPHAALLDRLRSIGGHDKRVHAITSISALTRLAESGLGIATLPLAAAKHLISNNRISILQCELKLAPLPLYASYRNNPASVELTQAIEEALRFARNFKLCD
jgi:DNA-binding transcriptional LysR family regulator